MILTMAKGRLTPDYLLVVGDSHEPANGLAHAMIPASQAGIIRPGDTLSWTDAGPIQGTDHVRVVGKVSRQGKPSVYLKGFRTPTCPPTLWIAE